MNRGTCLTLVAESIGSVFCTPHMNWRLLIVDDQKDVARTLGRALRGRGFGVSIAHSCAEAEALDVQVDCAVLDIDLPDGTGLELAERLIGEKARAVVFFSGCSDECVRVRAAKLGPLVAKSAGLSALITSINEVMGGTFADLNPELAAGEAQTPSSSGSYPASGRSELASHRSASFRKPTAGDPAVEAPPASVGANKSAKHH